MTKRKTAPFGSWPSPIGTDKISSAGISTGALSTDGDKLYWLEGRPLEGGRNVIVERSPDGQTRDITPEGFNARTRVHEYGGGSFVVDRGTVLFANFTDQRLYTQKGGSAPQPLTPEGSNLRYADPVIDRARNRIICVREDHRGQGEPVNTLVAIDLTSGGEGEVLFEGTDFVSSPRMSPDGSRLAFVTWDHPNMPWDVTALHVAELSKDGAITTDIEVKQPVPGSITQPSWAPDGELYFVADWSNWWNLYRFENGTGTCVCEFDAEFAAPAWVFGQANYALRSASEAVVSYSQNGLWHLATLDLGSGELATPGEPHAGLRSLVSGEASVCFLSDASDASTQILSLGADNTTTVLRAAPPSDIPGGSLSRPSAISFPSAKGETAYGFFYPPTHEDYEGPTGALPPLLVSIHGGPTSATSSALSYKIQYWTTRGFAILDLNYRGSTGFGRDFRQKLYRTWGIADVEDACAGAQFLAEQGRVDAAHLAISGGSAGGLTALNALAHHDTFSAGGSFFGVSDLEALAQDTHKFESRYCDLLIGKYPEEKHIYDERSPIHSIEKIRTPLLILQGLDDPVVPPRQSESVFEALQKNKVPVCYIPFEGEQHGFRRAENIERAISAELAFYGKVFGFEPADDIEPLDIVNSDQLG
jgi:dipeptidyl aminopeptidase/acylaminoacyl peptidase